MSRFDELIDRRQSSSRKWDGYKDAGIPGDALPLWVADMDFKTLDEVTEALVSRAESGVYGYPLIEEGTTEAIQGWMKRRFNWEVDPAWIIHTPGIVFALHLAVQLFTEEGDSVLINRPVYPPFAKAAKSNQRRVVDVPLIRTGNCYEYDFEQLEQMIVKEHIKLYILCNPHNPVGKVATAKELQRIAAICEKHDVMIISDEIHQDFVYPGYTHIPFLKANPSFEKAIICTAPSKTFNLAGMQFSNVIIANSEIREQFEEGMERLGLHMMSSFSSLACKQAYLHGDAYVEELVDHIRSNVAYVRQFLQEKLPRLQLIEPQSLYLLWIDFSGYGLSGKALEQFLVHDAKLWLSLGEPFGDDKFARMNVACHRSTLIDAMERLYQALLKLEEIHA